jgi:hypothetical protein
VARKELNLSWAQPAIRKGGKLLIEGIQDLGVPMEHVKELWRSWGQPDIWRVCDRRRADTTSPAYNAELVKPLSPAMQARIASCGAPLDQPGVPSGAR